MKRNDPYPNFHAARIKDPSLFKRIVVLKTLPNGIMVYGGPLKGETKSTTQAYRFPRSKFTVAQAKAWLKEHKIKYTLFEPATGKDSIDIEIVEDNNDAANIKLNSSGNSFTKSLINAGKIDFGASWEFTGADGNKLLGPNGDNWANFGKHHLAEDTSQNEKTKARYKYPFAKIKGNDSVIFRKGVIAIKQRAAQQGQPNIANAAGTLLEMIDKKKKDSFDDDDEKKMKTIHRTDFFLLPLPDDIDEFMESAFEIDDATGYLKGRAIVTNIGVFPYMNKDGNVTRELRMPEEVFDFESVDTLKMLPLTYDHPPEKVNKDNFKKYQVGSTGDGIRKDSLHLSCPMVINDPDAIRAITGDKKLAISCGYTIDLEEKTGNFLGTEYDAIQRNIRYNHIAVGIENGRAGDRAKIKLDRFDAICVNDDQTQDLDLNNNNLNIDNSNSLQEDNIMLKKVKIDGIEYDADIEVIKALNKLNKDFETLNEEHDTLKQEHETLKGKHDTLVEEKENWENEKKELEKAKPEKIDEAVKGRLKLIKVADKYKVEVTDEMSDRDIKIAVIKAAYPKEDDKKKEFDDLLKDASDQYIDARFDAAVEKLDDESGTSKENKEEISDFSDKDKGKDNGKNKKETDKYDSDAAYDRMVDRLETGYARN